MQQTSIFIAIFAQTVSPNRFSETMARQAEFPEEDEEFFQKMEEWEKEREERKKKRRREREEEEWEKDREARERRSREFWARWENEREEREEQRKKYDRELEERKKEKREDEEYKRLTRWWKLASLKEKDEFERQCWQAHFRWWFAVGRDEYMAKMKVRMQEEREETEREMKRETMGMFREDLRELRERACRKRIGGTLKDLRCWSLAVGRGI